MRGRGLKLKHRVGQQDQGDGEVAPRAGARIETDRALEAQGSGESPPVRGRGLKPVIESRGVLSEHVAPRAGARIETLHLERRGATPVEWSPPVRGRGLKPEHRAR